MNNDICLECTLVTGQQRPKNDKHVVIWMSLHKGKDFSARRAIHENYPKAKTPREIGRAQAHQVHVFRKVAATDAAPQSLENPVRNQIVFKASHAFLVLSMVRQMAWAATVEISRGLTSPMSQEPKNQ